MKETHLMNSCLYEAWKKAGLSDEDAKKAAMEATRHDVVIATLSQSMARLEVRIAEGHHINTVLIAIGVATDLFSDYISQLIKSFHPRRRIFLIRAP